MAKPIVRIHSDGSFKNTSIFVNDVPVQNCVHIMFIAGLNRTTSIAYVTAVKNEDSVLYEVTEYLLEPVDPESEAAKASGEIFQAIEHSSKLIAQNELERFVPGYLISVFSMK